MFFKKFLCQLRRASVSKLDENIQCWVAAEEDREEFNTVPIVYSA